MIIHVVQQGETIQSIAEFYGTSVDVLILNNALDYPNNLVVGQCIVVVFPELVYTVKEGDNLYDISVTYNVTVMQLLQNNPYLSDRAFLIPGDRIVISYEKKGFIVTHGLAAPYISQSIFRKTLPFLTYLSVVNYASSDVGEVISYYDDTEFVKIAKEYNVIPLMFLTTLTLQGDENLGAAYNLLLNEESQDKLTENILRTLREKGFYGINISYEYINVTLLPLIENAYGRIARRLKEEGFLALATINPNITVAGEEIQFEKVDFTVLSALADEVIFMNFERAMNINPPSPISSLYHIDVYLDFLMETIPVEKLVIGLSTIGYDWELPFFTGISSVHSLTYNNAVALARNKGAIIYFDEVSQTPFFNYTIDGIYQIEHIVWFVDARSINSLIKLAVNNSLSGTGIWNMATYNAQLWLIFNSQFEIVKFEVP
jgi:spore germination protein